MISSSLSRNWCAIDRTEKFNCSILRQNQSASFLLDYPHLKLKILTKAGS